MENKQDQKKANSQEEAADVEAFFAKHRKDKKGKTSKKKESQGSATKVDQDTNEQEASSPSQPTTEAQPNYDSDSSNEEKQQIVLEDTRVKDMKSQAEKEEEKKAAGDNFGWGKMEQKAKTAAALKSEEKKPAPAKNAGGEISFGRGRPQMFTSKKKGLGLAQEEFPEMGALGAPTGKGEARGSDAQGPKANSASIGQFGAMAQERDGEIPQQRIPTKKPMFTGKAKLNSGGNTGNSDVNTKQNYDFSTMNMAQATANKPRLDEEGNVIPRDKDDERTTQQRARQQNALDDEDGFEVVKEKQKRLAPKNFGDDAAFAQAEEKPQWGRRE